MFIIASPFLLQALSRLALLAVGDGFYKVTAEALRVCGEIVRVVCHTEVQFLAFFSVISDIYYDASSKM